MADIVFDRIDKIYDNGFQAITDLNLEIRDSEFMVMVGPSGCGKSTALRMVPASRTSRAVSCESAANE